MTETSVATRTVHGVELPAVGVWRLDPGHAEVGFVGRHFLLTKVRGRFTGVEGTVQIAENPADSKVAVTIDMTTVTSGDDARDNHLKSADFFDVADHRTATFVSTNVDWDGTAGSMTGMLTIKDVTAPVTFTIDYLGHVLDPWNNERTVFSARSKVNRADWHLTWNMPLARGGLLVSTEIDLELEVELVLDRAAGYNSGG